MTTHTISNTKLDCPICLDVIQPTKNCIITECNHTFHASSMFKSAAHGNFDCPCCRFELAELPDDDEEEDYEEEEDEEEEDELFVGFRALFVRAEGLEYDDEDEDEDGELNIPLKYFVDNFKRLNYTYEDLVKILADEVCYKYDINDRSETILEKTQELAETYQPGDEIQVEEIKHVFTVARFRNTIDLCGNN